MDIFCPPPDNIFSKNYGYARKDYMHGISNRWLLHAYASGKNNVVTRPVIPIPTIILLAKRKRVCVVNIQMPDPNAITNISLMIKRETATGFDGLSPRMTIISFWVDYHHGPAFISIRFPETIKHDPGHLCP
jgi:hypothetical protein